MERGALLAIAGATLAAAWMLVQWGNQQQPEPDQEPGGEPFGPGSQDSGTNDFLSDIVNTATNYLGLWRPPAKYAGLIRQAEAAHGLPADLLARLLWQECRYREDIITGRTRSPAGALGIAQFMPATAREMGIDPLNPAQAIDAAGRYLAQLFRRFGNWREALAAYNWGMGNVSRKGLANAPRETRNYYSQILADVNKANGTAWA